MIGLLFTNSFHANADEHNYSHFGIKGGLNISNLHATDVEDQNINFGFHAGVFIKIALTRYISFQPEILYTTKGAELKYNNESINGTANYSLNYFEMPLLAMINLTKNVNIHGGVYLAKLTSVKIKNEDDLASFNIENELNKDNFESLYYGLVVGLGSAFNRISVGIRYEYGLEVVGKEVSDSGQSYHLPDASNSSLQFYL